MIHVCEYPHVVFGLVGSVAHCVLKARVHVICVCHTFGNTLCDYSSSQYEPIFYLNVFVNDSGYPPNASPLDQGLQCDFFAVRYIVALFELLYPYLTKREFLYIQESFADSFMDYIDLVQN